MFSNGFTYILQTLNRMYVVNAGPGFKKMLWPAAQKFLDAKTIAKIHVNTSHLWPIEHFKFFWTSTDLQPLELAGFGT